MRTEKYRRYGWLWCIDGLDSFLGGELVPYRYDDSDVAAESEGLDDDLPPSYESTIQTEKERSDNTVFHE